MIRKTSAFVRTSSAGVRRWGLWLVLALCLILMLLPGANPVTRQAQAQANRVALAAGATYVSLRGVNAVLSAAQEVEVGGNLVVSGTVQPLKVLEPVDDTIERISSVVFAVLLVAGVASVGLGPVSAVGAGLVAAGLCWRLLRVPGGAHGAALTRIGLVLMLALPGAFLLAGLSDLLTAAALAEHQATIAAVAAELAPEDTTLTVTDPGWSDWMRALSSDAARYREMVAGFVTHTDDLINAYLGVLSIYLLRMVLMPLVFLGVILAALRHARR